MSSTPIGSGNYNGILYGINADFSQASLVGQNANTIKTNGQLWIGSTTANAGGTHINIGTIVAGSGITIGYSSPNITISASGSSGISTISGDSGSITGSTVTIYADVASLNSGSTVEFVNSGTTSTFNVTDANSNIIIGKGSGNASISGSDNTGLGQGCLSALTSGSTNCSFGQNSLLNLTGGSQNTAIGTFALRSSVNDNNNTAVGWGVLATCNGGIQNTSVGQGSMISLVNGNSNCGFGLNALAANVDGTGNTAMGEGSGRAGTHLNYNTLYGWETGVNYTTTESYNILIGNAVSGVIGESNTLRIGNTTGSGSGGLVATFIQGIYQVAPSNPYGFVTIQSSGQVCSTSTIPLDTFEILGQSTNIPPATGALGQQIRSAVASGSAVSLTTATPTNITSISLTAGIWDVSCVGVITGTLTGVQTNVSISLTSATLGTNGDNNILAPTVSSATSDFGLSIPSYRVSLSTTTSVFLVMQSTFTIGTAAGYGRISGTRVA